MIPSDYGHHVRKVRFRRRLFGYHPDDVRRHLHLVSGWFSLSGVDALLDERIRELADQAEQRLRDAEADANVMLAAAQREADRIRRTAREEAWAILEQARREAALERRGRSRVGRPLGRRSDVTN
jgi:cell division septum initiation protein DivIVA